MGTDSCSVDEGNWVEKGCRRGGGSSSAQSRSMDVGWPAGEVSGVDGMLLRGEVGGEVINVDIAVQFNKYRGGEPGAGLQKNVRASVRRRKWGAQDLLNWHECNGGLVV
ncbi:hypothetical protein FISHEDRAFT_61231 [Fistulina hepatica ATCC 64428]|uniref:Uncharacterized protein n=1 Tax=Fistulina hepatica ATCC 64428 TaxID=1128425 RepID=A0A0D7A3F4_9AGAR|nr:hypothetical protein FISHEDRAFT_61231 [Fistulina hepatica ATCC 64428]